METLVKRIEKKLKSTEHVQKVAVQKANGKDGANVKAVVEFDEEGSNYYEMVKAVKRNKGKLVDLEWVGISEKQVESESKQE